VDDDTFILGTVKKYGAIPTWDELDDVVGKWVASVFERLSPEGTP